MNAARLYGLSCLCAVLLAGGALVFFQLGRAPLQDYDEATYAQVVHEARENGDFLSFTFGGAPFLEKPPLMFWLMGLSESLLGESEFSMRLPFALAGLALIAALMGLVYEASGSFALAALAGAMAFAMAPLLETMREVRLDAAVTACILASIYGFMRGLREPRWFLFFGVFAGLAVLAKSVIAVFALAWAFFLVLFLRRLDICKNRYFWYGAGVFLLVAAPWHLYETWVFGFAFWREYIGVQVFDRTQENLFWTVTITNADLLWYVWKFFEPWLFVLCAALVFFAARWRSLGQMSRASVLSAVATLACMALVFFSSATKAPTYLIPMYPMVALIITLSFFPLLRSRMRAIAWVAAVALVAWGGAQALYNAYHLNPYYSVVLAMAQDEKRIGALLARMPEGEAWYVYRDQNLGSIMYYSQRLRTRVLSHNDHAPEAGSYVVMDSGAREQFAFDFSSIRIFTLYSGRQVTLVRVLN